MSSKNWLTSFLAPPSPTNLLDLRDFSTQIAAVRGEWRPLVQKWSESESGKELLFEIYRQRFTLRKEIVPKFPLRALTLTDLSETKIVILGDGPSSVGNVADGLAFSSGLERFYSTETWGIIEELRRDLGIDDLQLHSLDHWASRGALLLNCILTAEHGHHRAHYDLGWEILTDQLIGALAKHESPKVFLLWGRIARSKALAIRSIGKQHLVLESAAPTKFETQKLDTFSGCGHFGKSIEFLMSHGANFDWSRPEPTETYR